MAKKASGYFMMLLEVALLAFTVSRTFDLISQFLPVGQEDWAGVAVAAFDIGLVGWTFFYCYKASGAEQRAIGLMMIIVSLLAVSVSTGADIIISAAGRGIIAALDPGTRMWVVVIVVLVVVANISAFILTFVFDPDRKQLMEEEAARGEIRDEIIRQIKQSAKPLAAQIAPVKAQEWVQRIADEYTPGASKPVDGKAGGMAQLAPFSYEADQKAAANGRAKAHRP